MYVQDIVEQYNFNEKHRTLGTNQDTKKTKTNGYITNSIGYHAADNLLHILVMYVIHIVSWQRGFISYSVA